MTPTRPVLRYHGGKWRLAPEIISHMPPHRVYVEPYGGAASVLLRKPRVQTEVYNDMDAQVVSLFSVLRDPGQAIRLIRALELTPFSRAEFDAAYEPAKNPVEAARRLMVLSFMGHSSKSIMNPTRNGFRSKRAGENSPAIDWWRLPSSLCAVVKRMSGVVIEQREALEVIRRYDAQDALFYVDPPYVQTTRNMEQGRYRHELTEEDHVTLSAILHDVQGMVMISGYRSALYDELYAGWIRIKRRAYADMSSPRVECLWFNSAASAKSPRLGLLELAHA